MVNNVQAMYPEVMAMQVHAAWTRMSKLYWRRDDDQLTSAAKFLAECLDDVDVFKPVDIPEGMEILCWGMKKIAGPLDGKIFKVGVDATYNMNSKHLKLYSVMANFSN
ncbi:hypothetical protein H0H87_001438 [Tephrocybe sp. NHM501043]|nr:hypothetical protein H0H87_001438 [Tephrocybe sp. NHM501043]